MEPYICRLKWGLLAQISLFLVACDPGPKDEKSVYEEAIESLDAKGIEQGPIRHGEISADLDARIRKFALVFSEVYPITHEEWLDGFRRDTNPENEIIIWEDMATAYSKFLEANELEEAARSEAFNLLVVRSGTENMDSSYSNLKSLTIEQAQALVASYSIIPKPVKVRRAEQGTAPQIRPR